MEDCLLSHKISGMLVGPMRFQLDVRLIRPLQLRNKEFLQIKSLLVLEHMINSPTKLMSQD